MRIARHPDASRIVLSIWQGTTCQATVRLAPEDVATLVGALTGMLVPPSAEPHRQAG